jgi:membrane peptidoglycan carboxypeptidase
VAKKTTKSRSMSVYSNLTHKRKTKKDAQSRKKAEYLASLPKHPVKRLLYRLHPKRFFGYWFSKQGGIMALKVAGVAILLVVLTVGALFAYYRKDLDQIQPGELAKRVQTTVTKYYDRRGPAGGDAALLWEDKGSGDYKLVVDGNDISSYMKNATVAIEDKDFYKHGGISLSGIFRSAINNIGSGSTQGGSTLTQQLVKQVFFADQASDRGLSGIPRKIKEMILAVEVERMYDKGKILDLYLNESPYGGRRNGVESGAQTYFGVSSKDLTLPQAALLAAIPNNPSVYNPYNLAGRAALVERQHKVLDNMQSQGYITKAQADDAKKFPIIDSIKPQSDQFNNVKAPHFVQMVKSDLEKQLGKATVGQGGLTVTTTLDLTVQNKLEEQMNKMFNGGFGASTSPGYIGYSNGAATIEDTQTGQIIGMVGSRSFDYPGFGQDNAALAYIQPGSSIKPLVYAQLFQNQGPGKANYGSGSVLSDDASMDGIYGAPVKDADGKYMGNISIRKALDFSRNIPAIKAMYVAGKDATWKTIRDMGDTNYCTQGQEVDAGLSSAIGGCTTRQVDHTNALASLARMGVYKPWSSVLEVKNSRGEVLEKYKDESKQVIDPQAAYIVNDILGDVNTRKSSGLYPAVDGGGTAVSNSIGLKVALKTGTSDKDGQPKDIWTVGYTPHLSMAVWLGNSDTSVLHYGYSFIPAKIVDPVLAFTSQLYQQEGKGNVSDWFARPAGIQTIGGELYPAWYNKSQSQSTSTISFDKVSKMKATSCTPVAAKIDIAVIKTTDPITKKDTYIASDGYDATQDDNVHNCGDALPTVGTPQVSGGKITATVSGPRPIQSVTFTVGGTTIQATVNGNTASAPYSGGNGTQTITATVTDSLYYTNTSTGTTS